jgi:DNA-binding CsgD family transcriptional regulator
LLTPREQEVLQLLREGLTNQQIADRLGITLYGARYHVSEILSKLGVASREEAAVWHPEAASRFWGLAGSLHRLTASTWFKAAAGAAIGVAAVAIVLLALGVVAMGHRRSNDTADTLVTPTPTDIPEATSTVSPDALPVGPLVVALEGNPQDQLLIYDAGTSRTLVDITLPGADSYTGDARAGKVLVASRKAVSEVDYDGSMHEVFTESREDYGVAGAVISPDGKTAAIAVQHSLAPDTPPTPDDGDYLLFLDLATGKEVSRITKPVQPEPGSVFDGYNSQFQWLTWRNDGTGVVVAGATGSERPGGWATLYLDGRVVRFDNLGYAAIAPDGRVAAEGQAITGCMSIGMGTLSIFDLSSLTPVVSVSATDDSVLTAWAWSPDSAELIVAESPLVESEYADGLCPDFRQRRYRLLDIASGGDQPLDDLDVVYRKWYAGDPLLSMDCNDGTRAYATYVRLGARYVMCDGDLEPHALLLNGRSIAKGAQFQVLGIIQP